MVFQYGAPSNTPHPSWRCAPLPISHKGRRQVLSISVAANHQRWRLLKRRRKAPPSPLVGEGVRAKRGRKGSARKLSPGLQTFVADIRDDGVADGIHVAQHIVIPEAQHAKASSLQLGIASRIFDLDSACWLPSTSITSFASRQTKSAMYFPIGTCRRNLMPSSRRSRSSCHSRSSASVGAPRIDRANWRFVDGTVW